MNKKKKNVAASVVAAPKRYDDALKRQAVEHWLRSGRKGTQIAHELGMSYPSLTGWKRRYGGEAARCMASIAASMAARSQHHTRKRLARLIPQRPRLLIPCGL